MREHLKRYGVSTLIVLGLLLAYHVVQSYRHFEWQNMSDGKGSVFALPAWRK